MNFTQFCQALTELSPKRFTTKSKEDAEAAMVKLVDNKSPGTTGATVSLYSLATNTNL